MDIESAVEFLKERKILYIPKHFYQLRLERQLHAYRNLLPKIV